MKVLCVIDHLGPGGAQRQMSLLAVLLRGRGYDVRLVTYYPQDFHKPLLDKADIPVDCVSYRSKPHRIWAVRKAIRADRPEVVIAYLQTPSILAELASLPRRDYALIVSERNQDYPGHSTCKRHLSFWLHRLADAVVTNSHAQEALIRKIAPKLASRTTTILNCVDLRQFRPAPTVSGGHKGVLHILCVGRFAPQKNYMRLLEAVEILGRYHPETDVLIDIYGGKFFRDGKPGFFSGEFFKLQDAVKGSPAQSRFRLHDPVSDVAALYHQADVLCLPSLYEGCSNVICEAMACGKPILASRVGDNAVLVGDSVNGFLFDPSSPDDIANTILRFSLLSPERRMAMGEVSRQRAEILLSPHRFIEQYEVLLEACKQKETGLRKDTEAWKSICSPDSVESLPRRQ